MRAVLESYYVAVSAVAQQGEPLARRALEKRISEQYQRAALLGEVELPEANNAVTFGNALDLLIRRGVLARGRRRGPRPPRARVRPRPAWSELAQLRERLATALRAR
jgi:glycerol-3-phosphate O-acyltransferase